MRRATPALALLFALGGCTGGGPNDANDAVEPASAATPTQTPAPRGADAPVLACNGLDRPIQAAAQAGAARSEKGRALPELTLDCLGGGKPVTLRGLRGPMVLNVWASWCGPCRDELPFLTAAHEALGARVRFAGLAMNDDDGPAREWLSFHGVAWPSLFDHKGSIRGPLRVPGPPVTLFVNSAGLIVEVHYGAFTSARQVQDAIAEHLGVA